MDLNILKLLTALKMVNINIAMALKCKEAMEAVFEQHPGELPDSWQTLGRWLRECRTRGQYAMNEGPSPMIVINGVDQAIQMRLPFPELTKP